MFLHRFTCCNCKFRLSTETMSTKEKFLELVNQRLCQGFQLVVGGDNERKHYNSTTSYATNSSLSPVMHDSSFGLPNSPTGSQCLYYYLDFKLIVTCFFLALDRSFASNCQREAYKLNHGRQYHIVKLLSDGDISVKIYRPR